MTVRFAVINTSTMQDWSIWDSFSKAKSECDAAKEIKKVPFIVERREAIYSSETLDELMNSDPALKGAFQGW